MEKKNETKDAMVYIQGRLNAPKNQRNNFGKYNYRSCEDILEALKPLLAETECTLTISDDIVDVSGRIYVKATATLTTQDGLTYTTTAFAREADTKSGMDVSQITGAASSYARKYALNGLFCIDDNKDADALNVSKEFTEGNADAKAKPKKAAPKAEPQPAVPAPAAASDAALKEAFEVLLPEIQTAPSVEQLSTLHARNAALHDFKPFKDAMNKRYKELTVGQAWTKSA